MNLIEALRAAIAENFAFYFMAQAHHHNVRGPLFPQTHELFGALYDDVHGAHDGLSEMLRSTGELAFADPVTLLAMSLIRFTPPPAIAMMYVQLIEANEIVIRALKVAGDAATEADERGIENYIRGRLEKHTEWRFKLGATVADDASA